MQAQPIKLDGEQVVLTDSQVDCGVQMELWQEPVPSGDRKIARLLPKGQELKFFDDVVVGDTALGSYGQVRGDFTVTLTPPLEIHDGPRGSKLVNGKVGATINHSCFSAPLPIMGVRRGQFAPNAPVQLRYEQDGSDWRFDRLVH